MYWNVWLYGFCSIACVCAALDVGNKLYIRELRPDGPSKRGVGPAHDDVLVVEMRTDDSHLKTLMMSKNPNIPPDMPVRVDGKIVDLPSSNSAHYYDVRTGTALTASIQGEKKSFQGVFTHDGQHYVVIPDEVDAPVIRASRHNNGLYHQHTIIEMPQHIADYRSQWGRGINLRHSRDSRPTNTTFEKRDEFNKYEVEMILYFDHTFYTHWMTLKNNDETKALQGLRDMYSFQMNIADLVYKSIDSNQWGFTISLIPWEFIVCKSQQECPATSRYIFDYTNKYGTDEDALFNGDKTLNDLRKFAYKIAKDTGGIPDHFMTLTRYNMAQKDSNGNNVEDLMGLAYPNQVCRMSDTYKTMSAVSVLEDQGFYAWQIIAHELGHSLGAAKHDDPSSCGDRYIMNSAVNYPEDKRDRLEFSYCSLTQFYLFLPGDAGAVPPIPPSTCLLESDCSRRAQLPNTVKLPGEIIFREQATVRKALARARTSIVHGLPATGNVLLRGQAQQLMEHPAETERNAILHTASLIRGMRTMISIRISALQRNRLPYRLDCGYIATGLCLGT